MSREHRVHFHVSGFPHDQNLAITLRRLLYWSNWRAYWSGIHRRLVWGGMDAKVWYNIDVSHPDVFGPEWDYHVWISQPPADLPRDTWGAAHYFLPNGDAAAWLYAPRVPVGEGYEGLWWITTTDHEVAHTEGVAVPPGACEVYNLERFPGIFEGVFERCMAHSPMRGTGWVEGMGYAELMKRNVYAPHEAAIINEPTGKWRGGKIPRPPGWPDGEMPGNPVPAHPDRYGWVSVHHAQASMLGFPQRETSTRPTDTLMPYPTPEPEPQPAGPTSWDPVASGKQWLIYGHGCVVGRVYRLLYGSKELSIQTAYESEIGFITRRGPGRDHRQKFTVEEVT